MFRKRSTRVVMLVILLGIILATGLLVSAKPTSASELYSQSIIIRTHEHMSHSDEVFRSQNEACQLPSRKILATQTGTKLRKWSKIYRGGRQVDYYGDPDVVVKIQVQKDQILESGEYPQKMRIYTYGETYVGTQAFLFRCFPSRNGWFNPNIPDFCPSRVEKLERWTNRNWEGEERDWNELPTGLYEYTGLRRMPGFWVPRSSFFITYKVNAGTERFTTAGYLTRPVPARSKPLRKTYMVYAFC